MLSPLAARKAEKLGFTKVKVFHAGLPEWKKSGGLIVSNVAAIENFDKNSMNYILIDVRPKAEIEKGHLPSAIMAPKGDVASLKDQFPKFKGAPIILYSADGKLDGAKSAFKTITGWGYKQVSILNNGFKGWKEAGKQIDKGPAATKIVYTRTLAPGEIEVAGFREALDKPSSDVVILDVRNKSETEAGMFPNAVNIPLDELDQKLSDLPKDKQILIHCSTGARAEMAYNILKKAGVNAKYVNAKVECEKDKCTIEE